MVRASTRTLLHHLGADAILASHDTWMATPQSCLVLRLPLTTCALHRFPRWEDPPKVEPSFPDVLEWHRDQRRFVDVVLKSVVGTVATKQPPGARQPLTIAELRMSDEKPEPTHFGHHAVHLLPEYRELRPTTKGADAHATLFDEIADSFAQCGVQVLERRMQGVPSVIVISPDFYQQPAVVEALVNILPANPELARKSESRRKSFSAGKSATKMAATLASTTTDPKKLAAESKKAAKRLAAESEAQAKRKVKEAKVEAKRLAARTKAAAKKAGMGSKNLADSGEPVAQLLWLPFYCTSNSPSWYKRRCPPALKNNVAFQQLEFEVWPG